MLVLVEKPNRIQGVSAENPGLSPLYLELMLAERTDSIIATLMAYSINTGLLTR